MDTTDILPNGTVDDVRNEVRKIIRDLAPAGGFVLASVHNLQPDIPPESIIAMFEAASQYGKYPISI
jgi:uroporphyrinogen decarboxylase